MKSGGYKVIDLKRIPLSNFKVEIPGVYEEIEANNKLCIVSGLYAGGIEYDDIAVLFTGGKILTAKVTDTLKLYVDDDDNVSVGVIEPEEPMTIIDASQWSIPIDGVVYDNPEMAATISNAFFGRKSFMITGLNITFATTPGLSGPIDAVVVNDASNSNPACSFTLVLPSGAVIGILITVNILSDVVKFQEIIIKEAN